MFLILILLEFGSATLLSRGRPAYQVRQTRSYSFVKLLPYVCIAWTSIYIIQPQSTVGANGVPQRAVDGNRNQHYGGNSCTHTAGSQSNWLVLLLRKVILIWHPRTLFFNYMIPRWLVDLGRNYRIDTVQIWNRDRNDCCEQRINGAQVGKNV